MRHVDAETAQPLHEFDVELRDRHRLERKAVDAAVAASDAQMMVDEVEHDVEGALAVAVVRRDQAARGDTEG